MTADKEREELIQSIESELPSHPGAADGCWGTMCSFGEVADFILAREAKLRAEIKQIHKDYGCELRDPNGTIWEHAKKVQDENAKLIELVKQPNPAPRKVTP